MGNAPEDQTMTHMSQMASPMSPTYMGSPMSPTTNLASPMSPTYNMNQASFMGSPTYEQEQMTEFPQNPPSETPNTNNPAQNINLSLLPHMTIAKEVAERQALTSVGGNQP